MDGAEVLKTLGEQTRLRIFFLLHHAEMCVCELETILEVSQPNISRHLHKMKSAGIVDWYRDGQWIHYLLDEEFFQVHSSLPKALRELIGREEPYRKDQERYTTYRRLGFSCRDLKKDRDEVMDQLNRSGTEKSGNDR